MSKLSSSSSPPSSSAPPCRILFRSKQSVELYTVNDSSSSSSSSSGTTLINGPSTAHSFSPDGSRVIILTPSQGVTLVDLTQVNCDGDSEQQQQENTTVLLEGTKGVQFLAFSSRGTYILTWERMAKLSTTTTAPLSTDGKINNGSSPATPNLKIWHGTTGEYLYGIPMRNLKRCQWPPIRWTHDEKFAFHLVTNEIHVYDGHVFQDSSSRTEGSIRHDGNKIRCTGIQAFSLPPNHHNPPGTTTNNDQTYLVSTFVPELKGKPARISLLRYPDRLGTEQSPPNNRPPLSSKSFYQAEECTVTWSPRGDSALALTQTTVDVSGESYYGSTNLYLLLSKSRDGTEDGQALSVPLPKSGNASTGGPVHAIAWNPSPVKTPPTFSTVSGRMPALTALHDGNSGEPTFLFGNAHRNTLVFAPHGRFLTVGGFGNLAGGMDFYDTNKLKPCVQWDRESGVVVGDGLGGSASCAVGYGWSGCSRWFMVSTTSPRMNVDNGVKLYRYNGLMLGDEEKNSGGDGGRIVTWDTENFRPNNLLAAEFVPAGIGAYPDRPQSPPPKRSSDAPSSTTANATSGSGRGLASVKPKATVGRYIPPCARKGGEAGMGLAEKMRREREGSTISATRVTTGRGIFAGANIGGNKLPVGMAASDANNNAAAGSKSKNALRKERQRQARRKVEEAEKEEAERKEAEEVKAKEVEVEVVDPLKRAKKLKKTLKQIVELKGKDPASLNEAQVKKVAMEEELTKELAGLGL